MPMDMMQAPEPGMNRERMGQPEAESETEKTSIFIPESALGGRQVKVGEKIVATVKSVDPETREIEAECECDDGGGESEDGGYQAAFDRAMPESEMEE